VKLAFNTWVYSSFPVWVPAYPLETVIERVAAIGYDGIEIGAASPHAYPDYVTKERRREIKTALKANDIALASMLPAPGGGPGFNVASPIKEEREGAIDQYRKVIQLCADWGGTTCIYVAGWRIFGTERAQAWEWSRTALVEIAAFARDHGVTLAVEPTPSDSNLVECIDDALRMMTESEAANVKVMFDTYHVLYRDEVSSDYVYRAGKHLHHVHIADINRNPPGDGRIDYVALIAALKAVRFKGYLTMEIGFNRRAVEPDDFARRAYAYLKPLVK
jgi:protein FrlC